MLAGASAAAVAAIALLLAFSSQPQAGATVHRVEQTRPALEGKTAAAGGIVASGYVVARRSATVSVDITGRLSKVHFDEGARVKAGQLLAELDDGLARYDLQLTRARLESANAAVRAVEAEMTEAQAQLDRALKLGRTSTISPAALETSRTRLQALTARHEAAVADAKVAQVAIDRQVDFVERHRIRAPFAGVIIARNAQDGEILSPAAGGGEFTRTGIATLVDMDSLEVEVDINESQIAHVAEGQAASIVLDAYPDDAIPAKIVAIIPTADRDRATIQVRVAFDRADPRILPQMAAKVKFEQAGG